ncbi:MAG TPA: ABC transporter ATP-binding protein [Dehalococcoidia bacterium]|nr:ABC transporter ATP-binding protein [Dehalococcoidia bacterium]
MTLLETVELTKQFGGVTAVQDFDLCLAEGKVYGLLGPNGSGKTTLLNLVSRLLAPTKGKIFFRGKDITRLSPFKLPRLGIARTFQHTRLFEDLTLIENVMLGHYCREFSTVGHILLQTRGARSEERLCRARAIKRLAEMGLADLARVRPHSVSYGQQRLVEIARALMAEPQLLLLDEPTAGLSFEEAALVGNLVRDLARQGISSLIVEHNVRFLSSSCDWIIALAEGRKLVEGTPNVVLSHPKVHEVYFAA